MHLCNTDSVFVTAEKISCFHVRVISHHTTYEKKWLPLQCWSSSCLFGRLRPTLGEILWIMEKVWRSESCQGPHLFPFHPLLWAGEKYRDRCSSDVTHQKRKIEWKILPLRVPPTRNSFHELCDGVQFRNGTANHCNQVPICSHSH